jgi:hypothetical protein
VAIGRPVAKADHLFVIGTTPDQGKAAAIAEAINSALAGRAGPMSRELRFSVVKIEGSEQFYVVAGGLQTHSAAVTAEQQVKDAAFKLMVSDPKQAGTAKLLLQGAVVDGRQLAVKR